MEKDNAFLAPRSPWLQNTTTLIGVVAPILGLAAAVYICWGWGFSWSELILLVVMYIATGLGITVGYHRYFTHRSFETFRVVKFILAVLGSMAIQGSVIKWSAVHRRHHQHSDSHEDPHSPNLSGGSIWGVIAGWWHAHIGWLFTPDPPDLDRYVGDLRKDRLIRVASRLFIVWAALGLLIPALIGGLVTGTWLGALAGFIWGGLIRTFLIHHITWSINSVCHLWGTRPFRSNDLSRNNLVFGVLGLGEGWHNNHHAFPTSARHGLRWWEIDLSYYFIRAMSMIGLAWNVRVPPSDAVAARKQ